MRLLRFFWYHGYPGRLFLNKASALLWALMQRAIKRGNWEVKPHETVDGGSMINVPLKYQLSHHGQYGKDTVIEQY